MGFIAALAHVTGASQNTTTTTNHPFQGCTNQIRTLNMVDSTMKFCMAWAFLLGYERAEAF